MEACDKCKEVNEDRRTLWMACFYEMNELKLPFNQETIIEGGIHDSHPNEKHKFYTLRVCKKCRSDWMQAIKNWFHAPLLRAESCGSGIFIRENGINKEITLDEWNERIKNK